MSSNRRQPIKPPRNLPVVERDPIMDITAFKQFGCDVPKGSPPTPDRVSPTIQFERRVEVGYEIEMPDGEKVNFWVFFDPEKKDDIEMPSHIIRVNEGNVVHNTLNPSKNVHTIHHHGIEPTTFNDGVGKLSFEVSSEYTYQWLAKQAGTYFYHCHRNTVLHFEMGMYGLLIIDPPTGPGTVRKENSIINYDVEALWVADDVDPRWHTMNHSAGIACPFGPDEGLNRFDPEYFMITGVPYPNTLTSPKTVVNASVGDVILIRLLNASYSTLRTKITGLDAEVIEIDGRPLGQTPHSAYSQPFTVPADTTFGLTTSQRWGMLVTPSSMGDFLVRMEFRHWITNEVQGIAETYIKVT